MAGKMSERKIGIALDLGTSGFRAQAVDLDSGEVLSTAITTGHPLPGANVIDHLHFALDMGRDTASALIVSAVNRVIAALTVDAASVERLALCGNSVQLSLFQGLEVGDLAWAGERKRKGEHITVPDRRGGSMKAGDIAHLELPDSCAVLIPPAVSHTVGADGLAMVLQSGLLEEEGTALVTDYGTNAEMALCHNGRIFTASAAAGPALEGQELGCGMLAAPGAICDLVHNGDQLWTLMVLDDEMYPAEGPQIDFSSPFFLNEKRLSLRGITGTGVVSLIAEGFAQGLISLPKVCTSDAILHLGTTLFFDEHDLLEAGKAIGAVRAGHMTLCEQAGITYGDIKTVYLAGATGTYMDPLKAQRAGLIPPQVERVIKIGNSSLRMASALLQEPAMLERLQVLAASLKSDYCMLASSDIFKKLFILELSYWTEGMPMELYRDLLKRYGLGTIPGFGPLPRIDRTVRRDIEPLGTLGLHTITDVGQHVGCEIAGCTECGACVRECPQDALAIDGSRITLDHACCSGVACRRCERVCPVQVMKLDQFFRTGE